MKRGKNHPNYKPYFLSFPVWTWFRSPPAIANPNNTQRNTNNLLLTEEAEETGTLNSHSSQAAGARSGRSEAEQFLPSS